MGALVDGAVVRVKKVGATGEFGGDPGEIPGFALRLGGRLAERKALMVPEILDVLGAADADQLQPFEVRAIGQQDVGEMIGLIGRVGEANRERKFRHRIAHRLGVPVREHRIGPVDEPDVRRRWRRQFVETFLLLHPGDLGRAEGARPRGIGG